MPRPASAYRLRLAAAMLLLFAAVVPSAVHGQDAQSRELLRALVIDGQNNHDWRTTTPLIVKTLEATGRFTVDVATTPEAGGEMSQFQPEFADYAVVVSNYNGEPWSDATKKAFEQYVAGGGGFVAVHAANNSFPEWTAYNRMIGLGGWNDRNEKDGPYIRWRDGKVVRDTTPGPGGSHGQRHPFLVVVRDAEHPITRGLPKSWMQAADELYDRLRGPAENMHVLATAFSAPETNGSGEHEPILMTVHYGAGRVFHTTLGHDTTAMQGVAFQVTLQRGAEWAATGEVTLPPVDAQTLTDEEPAMRDPAALTSISGHSIDFDASPQLDVGSWKSLFNGKDLAGWTQKNGTARYSVEDGVVLGRTTVGSPNSFLTTDQDYRDFELAFEVKVDDGLNSGVQIRSKSTPTYKDGRVHGPQIEIESAPGESGYIYSEGTGRNWLSQTQPIKDAFKNGQWNQYLVRAVGPRIQTWVNGRKIEDLVDPESPQEGFIGLQVHGIGKDEGPYQVRWRNIQIRPLSDETN